MTNTKEERALHASQMRAHLAQEGGVIDPEKETLLQRYVEGSASLADLFDHAREYVTTAQEREDLHLAKQSDAAAFQRMREQYDASLPAYEEKKQQRNLERAGMSEEQRKRHEALDFARANVELSGGKISEEAAQRGLRWANGEITMDEYLDVSPPP
ncbi:antitoxin VbhA family protein [Janthinobacterium psychrotolerans]|uniref:Uncharacterized protein n=1 Tax=Janthinobacterium psychrotolerans TaxID=1747903 RepID=A0A1A7C6J7_9BURK|nr:antitoxin VbhA family protein [Janthinobacterium psychrotolerans]OBV41337.1 hypothetical protein ASR47_10294 [Janthinobacterium psychrotolerans]